LRLARREFRGTHRLTLNRHRRTLAPALRGRTGSSERVAPCSTPASFPLRAPSACTCPRHLPELSLPARCLASPRGGRTRATTTAAERRSVGRRDELGRHVPISPAQGLSRLRRSPQIPDGSELWLDYLTSFSSASSYHVLARSPTSSCPIRQARQTQSLRSTSRPYLAGGPSLQDRPSPSTQPIAATLSR